MNRQEIVKCKCGCGGFTPLYDKKYRKRVGYIRGHYGNWNNGLIRSEETKEKIREARKKQQLVMGNPAYKGGRNQMSNGYIRIWKSDHPCATKQGYIMEHRLVMEKFLGRYLEIEEVIHHKNHKRWDNRIENLELFPSHSQHMSEGHKHRPK